MPDRLAVEAQSPGGMMTLWVVKGGSAGEREERFRTSSVVAVGWDDLGDLSQFATREALKAAFHVTYPDDSDGRVNVIAGQLWAFVHTMQEGDTVVVPLKTTSQIAVGVVGGSYRFTSEFGIDMSHVRPVKWFRTDVPRPSFDPDLLYSFGAFMSVCTVKRDHAEQRVLAVVKQAPSVATPKTDSQVVPGAEEAVPDLEQAGRDAIVAYIRKHFKGHGLARLVDGVLRAQGFRTYMSPPGPDGGVDIVAGGGPHGLDAPRLVVQVKSGDGTEGTAVLLALKGVMANYGADQGLLVCWGGFKDTLSKDAKTDYFQIRLWNQADLVTAVLADYDRLDPTLKAELPLKRVWTLASDLGED